MKLLFILFFVFKIHSSCDIGLLRGITDGLSWSSYFSQLIDDVVYHQYICPDPTQNSILNGNYKFLVVCDSKQGDWQFSISKDIDPNSEFIPLTKSDQLMCLGPEDTCDLNPVKKLLDISDLGPAMAVSKDRLTLDCLENKRLTVTLECPNKDNLLISHRVGSAYFTNEYSDEIVSNLCLRKCDTQTLSSLETLNSWKFYHRMEINGVTNLIYSCDDGMRFLDPRGNTQFGVICSEGTWEASYNLELPLLAYAVPGNENMFCHQANQVCELSVIDDKLVDLKGKMFMTSDENILSYQCKANADLSLKFECIEPGTLKIVQPNIQLVNYRNKLGYEACQMKCSVTDLEKLYQKFNHSGGELFSVPIFPKDRTEILESQSIKLRCISGHLSIDHKETIRIVCLEGKFRVEGHCKDIIDSPETLHCVQHCSKSDIPEINLTNFKIDPEDEFFIRNHEVTVTWTEDQTDESVIHTKRYACNDDVDKSKGVTFTEIKATEVKTEP